MTAPLARHQRRLDRDVDEIRAQLARTRAECEQCAQVAAALRADLDAEARRRWTTGAIAGRSLGADALRTALEKAELRARTQLHTLRRAEENLVGRLRAARIRARAVERLLERRREEARQDELRRANRDLDEISQALRRRARGDEEGDRS